MSYTVLARKWRPQRFEDVVGQAHVNRSLENALSMGRVAHAYLFSGTRGVGKTTTARILAKALNCAQGPAPTPCGTCDSCREITQGSSVDVIEIDGASNTGVDNVRELRENVKYAPAKGRYKVYIIDEVHMLSTAAFNALLKTLEEPPSHVVFIFATTDPHKVPATILSRCQHYSFRRVPKGLIEAHLRALCDKEGLKVEDGALSRLATLAEGSVRDGLSLLDQVVSYCGDEGVGEPDIDEILGLVGREAVSQAARAIAAQDAAGALGVVKSLMDGGNDLRRFASALLEFFRDLLIAKVSPEAGKALDLPAAEVEEVGALAAGFTPEEILRVMNLLTRLGEEMKWTTNIRISLEMALVKASSRPLSSVDDILAGIKGMKDCPPAAAARAGQATQSARTGVAREVKEAASAYEYPAAPSKPGPATEASELWEQVAGVVREKVGADAPLYNKVKQCVPLGWKGSSFEVSFKQSFLAFNKDETTLVEEALTHIRGSAVKLSQSSPDKAKDRKNLADIKKEREVSRHEKIKNEAMAHPLVKSALELFGGELVDVEEGKHER